MGVTCRASLGRLAGAAKGLVPRRTAGDFRMWAAFRWLRLRMKKLTILSMMGPRLPWPPGPVMNCSAAVGGMMLVVSGLRAGSVGVGGVGPPSVACR